MDQVCLRKPSLLRMRRFVREWPLLIVRRCRSHHFRGNVTGNESPGSPGPECVSPRTGLAMALQERVRMGRESGLSGYSSRSGTPSACPGNGCRKHRTRQRKAGIGGPDVAAVVGEPGRGRKLTLNFTVQAFGKRRAEGYDPTAMLALP